MALACTRSNPAFDPAPPAEEDTPDGAAAIHTTLRPDAAPDRAADGAPAPPDLAPPPPDVVLPPVLALTEPSDSPAIRPARPGGESFEDACGPGRVLIGLVGTSERPSLLGLTSLQARCADLVVAGGPPWSLRTGDSATFPPHGSTGENRHDATCAANEVVVALEAATGQWIDRMYVHCAALSVREEAGGPVVAVEPARRLDIPLGPPTQQSLSPSRCPEGKIAVGIQGSAGFAVDWLRLRCARPALR